MAPVTVYNIKNGPSKFDLMLALFDHKNRTVHFVLSSPGGLWPDGHTLEIHITEVGLEDGSGESWCFKGQAANGTRYKGWFRTDSRKGTVSEVR
jgi:hypothetical protein